MFQRPINTKPWAALLLTGAICMASPSFMYAADTVMPLTNPSWTSTSLFTDKMDNAIATRATDVHALPSKNLVYVHTQQDIPNTTGQTKNNWYLDTVKAFDIKTGKLKWQYTLHDSAGPYTLNTDMIYSSYGTVYVYAAYSDGTYKLHSINSTGKLNWVKTLKEASSITMLKDSSLLVSSQGTVNTKGVVKSTISRYDSMGTLLNTKNIQGTVLKAEGDRIIVTASNLLKNQNGWEAVPNPKIDVYGLALTKLYSYQFPANINIYGDGSDSMFVLKDSTVLIRTNIDRTKNKMFAFNAKGKLMWGRNIPGGSLTQSTGTGYVVYDKQMMKLYNTSSSKVIASRELEGEPSADYTWVQKTNDGNLAVNLDDRTYILYPTNLSTVHVFKNNALSAPNDYVNHTIYSVDEDMLAKMVLK